ncbi:hypothetical protein T02_6130 [Trichinella nativa]|uniref:Uncharacterized protein n=1 Tax=Trichinella nativa TaxID=6335 RepID=A0A0V1JUA4_9BILA|nr:hypothetical protein T02_6130 [Trichinella nativa]
MSRNIIDSLSKISYVKKLAVIAATNLETIYSTTIG